MRLTEQQRDLLKTAIQQLDENARVFLFGSRVDDTKKGGDIDLLIFSEKLQKKQLRTVKWRFYDSFGEQKMDIVLDSGHLDTAFAKMIYPNAVEL